MKTCLFGSSELRFEAVVTLIRKENQNIFWKLIRNKFYRKTIRRGELMPMSSIEGMGISIVDVLLIEGYPNFI